MSFASGTGRAMTPCRRRSPPICRKTATAVLSVTTIRNRTVLRAAFVNHRTTRKDVDAVVRAVVTAGLTRTVRSAVAGAAHAGYL